MAREYGLRHVSELAAGPSSLGSQHVESFSLVHGVTLHEDALGPLRDGPSAERPFQSVLLGEPSQDDVEGAGKLLGVL